MVSVTQNLWKFIRQVYPPLILLMVLYVQLTVVLLNYKVFRIHEVVVLLCWLPFLVLPYLLLRKDIYFTLLAILFFIDGIITLFHITTIRELFIPYSLVAFAETNADEAGEFLATTINYTELLIIPYILIFLVALKKRPHYNKSDFDLKSFGVISFFSICVLIVIYLNFNWYKMIFPNNARTLLNFRSQRKLYNEFEKRDVLNLNAKIIKENDEENVFVLILGESCNRNHLSLYGYDRNTSIRLKQRNDIVVFTNVVSPYPVTVPSVLSILTESNLDNKKPYQKSISLIDIFHSTRHRTYWISSQARKGIYNNAIHNLSISSDSSTFYELKINSGFDDVQFKPLGEILENTQKNKFVVMHLYGNHFDYKKRYPPPFNIFNSGKTSIEKKIDEYDNSIAFNDFVVDSIFTMLDNYSKKNPKSIVSSIYLSDHGENVYDEDGKIGHNNSTPFPKSQIEIPFIVWLSETYRDKYPQKTSTIILNADRPFISDDLFHSVIDLNNIKYDNFEPERSIFNQNFNFKRKRILGDNQDYDKK
jgi:heptose-I-phosphate ethanolaminephosphotransferase